MENATRKKRFIVSDEGRALTRRTKGEKALFAVVFVLFALYALSLVLPFVFMTINSFQGLLEYYENLAAGKPFTLPSVWHFENYVLAFREMNMTSPSGRIIYLPEMLFNSLWYSFITIFGGVFASCLTGYCLSKYRFKLRGLLYGVAIFTMTIPIIGSTGSAFKLASMLGIYNTPIYVVLTAFSGFGFNFLVMYGFFNNVSWSYAEAVFMDGGSDYTVFFRIMLPQAKAPALTLAIMAFITAWNDYMHVLLYLPDYPTLASGLYTMRQIVSREGNMPLVFAGLMVSILPVLVIYACFSNTIMKNFTMGGLKG